MAIDHDNRLWEKKCCSLVNKLVKVKYYDHVEFRNYPKSKVSPILREAVGWVDYEDVNFIILVFDKPSANNIVRNSASGLCILKNDVLELEEIKNDEGND
ncbi:MAG: hypothetical protein QXJ62_06275 [Nitrososphaeria archaeon]